MDPITAKASGAFMTLRVTIHCFLSQSIVPECIRLANSQSVLFASQNPGALYHLKENFISFRGVSITMLTF